MRADPPYAPLGNSKGNVVFHFAAGEPRIRAADEDDRCFVSRAQVLLVACHASVAVVTVDVGRIFHTKIAAVENRADDRGAIVGQPLSGFS